MYYSLYASFYNVYIYIFFNRNYNQMVATVITIQPWC